MSETSPFTPISRETVSSQIRNQLLERIASGELGPGDRMPSERELSDKFEVARTSVREAMQGLVSMRVVERRGNRAYVAEHLPEVVVEPTGDGRFQRAVHECLASSSVSIYSNDPPKLPWRRPIR